MHHRTLHSVKLIALILFLFVSSALAGGSLQDYQRADHLADLTRNKVFRFRVQPHWFDQNNQFWYRIATSSGEHEYYVVNAAAGTRSSPSTLPIWPFGSPRPPE